MTSLILKKVKCSFFSSLISSSRANRNRLNINYERAVFNYAEETWLTRKNKALKKGAVEVICLRLTSYLAYLAAWAARLSITDLTRRLIIRMKKEWMRTWEWRKNKWMKTWWERNNERKERKKERKKERMNEKQQKMSYYDDEICDS